MRFRAVLRYSPLLTLTAFFALAIGTGCGRMVNGKAEDAVNGILPDYLGPADKYRTRVDASQGAILRGHLTHVHIDGEKVRLADGLTADGLTLDLHEVNVDTHSKRLKSVESVEFAVTMREKNLNAYVRKLRPDINDLKVSLSDDGLTVRARPALLGYPTVAIAVSGGLTPRAGGTKMDFTPSGGKLIGLPVAGTIFAWLTRSINPAVDLTGMRVPVHVRSATTQDGVLTLSGYVEPQDLLNAQK